jgi:hypothetical protein
MISFFNKWVIVGVLALLAAIGIFWHDIADNTTDAVSGYLSNDEVPELLSDEDLPNIKEVKFERERNNIHYITVSDPQVHLSSPNLAQISLHLTSAAKGNDYPNLRIKLNSKTGEVLRTVEIGANQYDHGNALLDERVTLNIPLQPGEVHFTTQAFYPADASR